MRRPHGTGSVYFDAKREKWVGTFDAGYTANGTRRRPKVIAATERECKAKLRAKMREIDNSVGAIPATTTVKSFADQWIERRETEVRGTSWQADRSLIRNWIVPTIGKKRLAELTPAHVRAVHKAMRDAGRADSSITRAHAALMAMLKGARLDGAKIPQNIFDVKTPPSGSSDRDAIPLPDAVSLLQAAAQLPDRARWAAALLQGIRQAEALGLTWDRIDSDRGVIVIDRQLKPVPYVHGCDKTCGRRFAGDCPQRQLMKRAGEKVKQLDGALCLVEVKTRSGRREIPILPDMARALTEWREVAPKSPHNLVWPRVDGRPALAKDDDLAWYRLQDAAQVAHTEGAEGRRFSIHEARHTTATLLDAAGVPASIIIAIMGHAKITTTHGYQHADIERLRDAMTKVGALLQIEN